MDKIMTMSKYAEILEKAYGADEGWKFLLLKSLIFLYRLLGFCGLHIDGPIAVIVDSRHMQDIVCRELRAFLPATKILADMAKTAVEKALATNNADVVVVCYFKTRRCEECIQKLSEICKSRYITDEDGKMIEFNDLAFVVFDSGIPPELCECFSGQICFGGEAVTGLNAILIDKEPFAKEVVNMIIENWALLQYKLQNSLEFRDEFEGVRGTEIFRGVVVVCETLLQVSALPSAERKYLLDGMMKAQEQIQREWIIDDGTGGWDVVFRDLLFDASRNIEKIIRRERIADNIWDSLEKFPMYDNRYYYLPKALFSEICSPISELIGERHLKKILFDAGYIRKEGADSSHYSSHVVIMKKDGTIERPRRIILYRNKIDLPGQISWADAILMKGGDYDDHSEDRA